MGDMMKIILSSIPLAMILLIQFIPEATVPVAVALLLWLAVTAVCSKAGK